MPKRTSPYQGNRNGRINSSSASPIVRELFQKLDNEVEGTYDDFTNRTGFPDKSLTNWKHDRRHMKVQTAERLGRALGMKLVWVEL